MRIIGPTGLEKCEILGKLCVVKHLFFFFGILFTEICSAQMSGTYTIGGVTPDFGTIQAAIDSLENAGMIGPVTLNIRSGTYLGPIRIDSIPGNSVNSPLILQSELQDSTQVVISNFCTSTPGNGSVVAIYDTPKIIFRNLTIEQSNMSPQSNGYMVFYIEGDVSFSFYKCSVKGPANWPCASIEYYPDNFAPNHIEVINSKFSGGGVAMTAWLATTDSVLIDSSIFLCGVGLSVGYSEVSNCSFDHDFSVGDYYVIAETHFHNNVVTGDGNISSNVADVYENHFHTAFFGNWGAIYDVRNNVVDSLTTVYHCANLHDNKLLGDVWFSTQTDSVSLLRDSIGGMVYGQCGNRTSIKDCFVGGNVWLYCDSNCRFVNNHFTDDVRLDGTFTFFAGNKFDSSLFTPNGFRHEYYNNLFHGEFDMGYSDYARIVHNNFGTNAILDYSLSCQGPPVVMYNNFEGENSLAVLARGPGGNILHNYNNYHNALRWIDSIAWHYDPQYPSSQYLYTANPMLSGLCSAYLNTPFDIDSIFRPSFSTVGANEVCWNSGSVVLHCDDSVTLTLCSADIIGYSFLWSPTQGLNDSLSGRPRAHPAVSTVYTCTVFDSSMNVIQTDTLNVTVSNLPIAFAAYNWDQTSPANFTNLSQCATSYIWYFGDGDSSMVVNPMHQYGSSGIYVVTMIACNSFGCDTFSLPVTIWVIPGIENLDSQTGLSVYPNPVSDFLHFVSPVEPGTTVEIYDFAGRLVMVREVVSQEIEIYSLPNGAYNCLISSADRMYSVKLIVSR